MELNIANPSFFSDLLAMPPLSHWRDRSKPWTPEQSDVLLYIQQTATKNKILLTQKKLTAVMDYAKARLFIYFDSSDKLWRGQALLPIDPLEALCNAKSDAKALSKNRAKANSKSNPAFQKKFLQESILAEMLDEGMTTGEIKNVGIHSYQMSRATFFRLWDHLKTNNLVFQKGQLWFVNHQNKHQNDTVDTVDTSL